MGNVFYKEPSEKPFLKIKDKLSNNIYLVSYGYPDNKIKEREMEYNELLLLRKILKVPIENTMITES